MFLPLSLALPREKEPEIVRDRIQNKEYLAYRDRIALITDIALASMAVIIATLAILASNGVNLKDLNCLGVISNQTAYIMIGVSGAVIAIDLVAIIINSRIKHEQFKEEMLTISSDSKVIELQAEIRKLQAEQQALTTKTENLEMSHQEHLESLRGDYRQTLQERIAKKETEKTREIERLENLSVKALEAQEKQLDAHYKIIIDGIRDDLVKTQEAHAQIRTRLQELADEKVVLERKLEKATQKAEREELLRKNVENESSDRQLACNRAQLEIKELKNELSLLNQEKAKLDKNFADATQNADLGLKQQITEVTADLQTARAELAALTETNKTANERIDTLETQLTESSDREKAKEEKITRLETTIRFKEELLKTMVSKKQLLEKEKELAEAQKQLTEVERLLREKTAEYDNLETRESDLAKNLEAVRSELTTVQEEKQTLSESLQGMVKRAVLEETQKQLEAATEQVEALTLGKNTQQNIIIKLQARNTELETATKTGEQRIEELLKGLELQKAKLETATQEQERLQKLVTEKEDKISTLTWQAEATQQSIEQKDANIKTLEEQNKKNLEQFALEKEQLHTRLAETEAEIEKMKGKLQGMTKLQEENASFQLALVDQEEQEIALKERAGRIEELERAAKVQAEALDKQVQLAEEIGQQIKDIQLDKEALGQKVETASAQIKQKEEEAQKLREEKQELQGKLEQTLRDLEKQTTELKEEIATLKPQLEAMEKAKAMLGEEKEEVAQKLEAQKTQLSVQEKLVKELEETSGSQEKALEELKKAYEENTKKLEGLQKEKEAADLEMSHLKEESQKFETDLNQKLREAEEEKTTAIQKAKEHEENLLKKLEALQQSQKRDFEEIQHEKGRIQQELEQLKAVSQNRQEEFEQIQNEKQELIQRLTKQIQENTSISNSNTDLQEQHRIELGKIEALEKELKAAKEQLATPDDGDVEKEKQ